VCRGEPAQAFLAVAGEADADHPAVAFVAPAPDEARGFGAVDELHGAVVAEQQIARQITDRRRLLAGMALDGEQQLMLRGRETCLASPLLAPVEEFPQAGAEGQQVLVVRGG